MRNSSLLECRHPLPSFSLRPFFWPPPNPPKKRGFGWQRWREEELRTGRELGEAARAPRTPKPALLHPPLQVTATRCQLQGLEVMGLGK